MSSALPDYYHQAVKVTLNLKRSLSLCRIFDVLNETKNLDTTAYSYHLPVKVSLARSNPPYIDGVLHIFDYPNFAENPLPYFPINTLTGTSDSNEQSSLVWLDVAHGWHKITSAKDSQEKSRANQASMPHDSIDDVERQIIQKVHAEQTSFGVDASQIISVETRTLQWEYLDKQTLYLNFYLMQRRKLFYEKRLIITHQIDCNAEFTKVYQEITAICDHFDQQLANLHQNLDASYLQSITQICHQGDELPKFLAASYKQQQDVLAANIYLNIPVYPVQG